MWWASSSWEAIQNCFCTLDSTWSCCGKVRALNNNHPLIKGILPKMVFFGCCHLRLFFHQWGQCHWLCGATWFAACPAIIAHLTRSGARVTTAFVFFWLLFASCCCCLPAWLSGLAWHSLYKWLASLPCRWQSLKPLSLHPGALFLLWRLSLPWPPSLRSFCCSRWPCSRWW